MATVSVANVQPGQKNSEVKLVQQALIARGFRISAGATSYFGDQTKAAYAAFQRSLGYSGADADGHPGATSLKRLGFTVVASGSTGGSTGGTTGGTTGGGGLSTPGKIALSQVSYTDPNDKYGEAAMTEYAKVACALTGMNPTYGVVAMVTLARKESTYNYPGQRINTYDSNAWGPIMSDGYPRNCSRGAVQCIPPTFAEYHQAGTSLSIYNVVSSMCASINYCRATYGVNQSGSNFSDRVRQADPDLGNQAGY